MYEIGKMPASIDIGYTGEQDFRTVQIDMSEWVAKVPNGAPILMYIRPGESEPYPVEITYADSIITWSVTDSDLGTVGGTGLLQVWFGVEDEEQVMRKLGMSSVVVTIVHLSISGGANASTVQIPWLKEIMEMKNIILGYDYEAEAWAVGQRGGEDVPATDASYHNNAKYYSDQAEAAKTAAQTAQAACETEVSRQLSEIISNPDSPPLDRTLSSNVSAAPADMVGDLKSALCDLRGYTGDRVVEFLNKDREIDLEIYELEKELDKKCDETQSKIDLLSTFSVEKKGFYLINSNKDNLADGNGDHLYGDAYVGITDNTFKSEIYPPASSYVGERFNTDEEILEEYTNKTDYIEKMMGKTFLMQLEQFDIPIMYLDHPDLLTLRSKQDGTLSDVKIVCKSLKINDYLSKIKVQGASSQAYDKKNYTLTFKQNIGIKEEWGYHKKYVIKADWVDFSQMRNEMGAKLWGEIRKTRINTKRAKLIDSNSDNLINGNGDTLAGENEVSLCVGLNYGAVDAFPICVVINGMYWGLYSFNIPKDDWMANMHGDNEHEAILCADGHNAPSQFKEEVGYPNEDGELFGETSGYKAYDIEYVPDEDDENWVTDSLNNLISSAMASHQTAQEYIDAISEYVDVGSVIDYYILACIINHGDGTDKNYLLDTWDGTKWYFSAYDMDGTFGNHYSGQYYVPVKYGVSFSHYRSVSRLMYIMYKYNKQALISRYNELRNGVLSEANITDMIMNYAIKIPKAAYDYETLIWPNRPGTNTSNYNQMINYINLRCKYLDNEIATLQ